MKDRQAVEKISTALFFPLNFPHYNKEKPAKGRCFSHVPH